MKYIKGNFWDLIMDFGLACITTNTMVKKDGCAVMGAGIAKEAKERMPDIDKILGEKIKTFGDEVVYLCKYQMVVDICAFPTKHDWKENSEIELIEKSAKKLRKAVDLFKYQKVLLTKPGCGMGKLKWDDVKPILEKYFDDRFYIIG